MIRSQHTKKGNTRRRPPGGGLPQPGDDDAVAVLNAMRRIIRAVDIHSKRVGRSVGLTLPQMVVLRAIRSLGEVTSRTLSAHVHLSPPTITMILDNLEARGLVERVRSAIDRRVVHPRLTPAGEALLEAAPPLLQSEFMAGFAALSAQQRRDIIVAFETVADMMNAPAPDAAVLDIGTIPGERPGRI